MTVHDVNMMNLGAIITVTLILTTWGVLGLKDRWTARREERQAQAMYEAAELKAATRD